MRQFQLRIRQRLLIGLAGQATTFCSAFLNVQDIDELAHGLMLRIGILALVPGSLAVRTLLALYIVLCFLRCLFRIHIPTAVGVCHLHIGLNQLFANESYVRVS